MEQKGIMEEQVQIILNLASGQLSLEEYEEFLDNILFDVQSRLDALEDDKDSGDA